MSPRSTVIPLLLTLSLTGCAHFPQFSHKLNPMNWFSSDESVEKPAELFNILPAITVTQVWHTELSTQKPHAFSPAATLDGIYAASEKKKLFSSIERGQLFKLDAKTGRVVWQSDPGPYLSAAGGASDDDEYTGTLKGDLVAWDHTGKQHWHTHLSSEVIGVPKVAEGIVVVRTENGDIYGLDSATGVQKWRYQHQLPTLTLHAQPGVVIYKGAVFAGYAGGKLVALTLDSGSVGWEADVSVPHGATEIERVNDITSTPVVDDREVCAVNYNGHLACFDVHSGNQLWAKDISSTAGLTMDDSNLYVTDTHGYVYAYEKEHGVSIWTQFLLRLRQVTAPRRVGDYVAVGDYQGFVHLLALNDGHFIARMPTDGSAILTQPLEYHHGVIVQTAKGGVFRFALP